MLLCTILCSKENAGYESNFIRFWAEFSAMQNIELQAIAACP
jgi:hypothetical protein